jgi:hypothetical protein
MSWYWVLVCVSGAFCLGLVLGSFFVGTDGDDWAPRG